MVLKNKRILTVLFSLFITASVFALRVPELKGYVNDYGNVISPKDEAQISEYLHNLENSTGIQIAVLTVGSLNGEPIEQFSMKVCEEWKIGKKNEDNGALLLVAVNDRNVRIEVGYGLEGKLTDAKCGLIIRNIIIPEFKNGNYSAGIYKAVKNMGGISTDNVEIVSKTVQKDEDEADISFILGFVIWFIFMFIVLTSKNGLFRYFLLGTMFRSGGNSHYMGGSSRNHSSFGGGSFGGGGFHGGGGHFGGGGASGHW